MQVRAEFAFRRDGRHHVAQRLAAHDALTGLHERAGQPRIGADRAIRLANGHVPAPEIIPHAGEHHAVAHADGGFAARRAQIDGGMRLPAVKRRPKHGLRGEAAKQPAGNGANCTHNGRKPAGAIVGSGDGLAVGTGEGEAISGAGAAACTFSA